MPTKTTAKERKKTPCECHSHNKSLLRNGLRAIEHKLYQRKKNQFLKKKKCPQKWKSFDADIKLVMVNSVDCLHMEWDEFQSRSIEIYMCIFVFTYADDVEEN